jgi:hypothetical protein
MIIKEFFFRKKNSIKNEYLFKIIEDNKRKVSYSYNSKEYYMNNNHKEYIKDLLS